MITTKKRPGIIPTTKDTKEKKNPTCLVEKKEVIAPMSTNAHAAPKRKLIMRFRYLGDNLIYTIQLP